MITQLHSARTAQRGIVLVSSLLLLLVVTIIALSMFRSFGIQEKIAGNMREKQRALHAAVTAQQYAETWLSTTGAGTASVTCVAPLQNANLNEVNICSNKLPVIVADVTQVPWLIGAAPVGVTYTPTGMLISNTTTSATNTILHPTYYKEPTFYISDMGVSADPSIPGEIYQVDAVGYGGNSNTVAVVESTYAVYTSSACRGCP
jgi:type IV pilus assembly protein PilX